MLGKHAQQVPEKLNKKYFVERNMTKRNQTATKPRGIKDQTALKAFMAAN